MGKRKENGAIDASTEEKIKNAARIVFQKKGYAATRTRDIAEEAGINLALLNYYFRSKEKLFEVVMFETVSHFFQTVASLLNDPNTTFEQKIERFVTDYLEMLAKEPNIPLFILSEIRNRPEYISDKLMAKELIFNSIFIKQLQGKIESGEVKNTNPLHFMMNLLSMTVFPAIGQPLLMHLGGLTEKQFNQIMQERKQMIPVWIKAMLQAE